MLRGVSRATSLTLYYYFHGDGRAQLPPQASQLSTFHCSYHFSFRAFHLFRQLTYAYFRKSSLGTAPPRHIGASRRDAAQVADLPLP